MLRTMSNGLAGLAVGVLLATTSLAQDAPKEGADTTADASNRMTISLTGGDVVVQLRPDLAPKHVERIKTLANDGKYDGVAFHRVIEGFMAQTGDVQHGGPDGQLALAGTGGSDLPDLPAEFSQTASFDRGTVGMARSQSPNSANSQFFIMFQPAPHLNGQYTIVGEVVEGMENIDKIKRGDGPNGSVVGEPDRMTKVTVGAPQG